MTDSSFYIIIDLIVAACGIYVIAQYVFMVRTHELRQNMMLPKELAVKRCKNVDGYIKAIGTKQLIFGIAAVVCGIINLAQDLLGLYNIYVSLASMLVFVVFCIWYGRASKKAIKEFW